MPKLVVSSLFFKGPVLLQRKWKPDLAIKSMNVPQTVPGSLHPSPPAGRIQMLILSIRYHLGECQGQVEEARAEDRPSQQPAVWKAGQWGCPLP